MKLNQKHRKPIQGDLLEKQLFKITARITVYNELVIALDISYYNIIYSPKLHNLPLWQV